MKLIEPTVRHIQQEAGIDGYYKIVAESAYICYQTDPEKALHEPQEFVEQVLIKHGHLRPLEFATIYLSIPYWQTFETTEIVSFFRQNHWSKVNFVGTTENPHWAITTNLRVLYENNIMDYIEMYSCEPTNNHTRRYCAEFIMSRGAADDFRTHVELSSVMESSRYCNYSQGKFNNELTFINPYWKDYPSEEPLYNFVIEQFKEQERVYLEGCILGLIPQELKRILPMGVKTTLRLCGYKDAWNNFFLKRCDSHADPECRLLANKLKDIIYVNN